MKNERNLSRRASIGARVGAAALLAVAAFATVGSAQAAPVSIDIRIGPPALRHEVIPAPRHGYVWVPGYWDWNGRRHVWIGGRYIAERPGYVWVQPTWVQNGSRWHYYRGAWAHRDYDRDGVRNRFDRDRDNDGRPNHRDRDRDGDGRRNRNDRRPDNPHRR